MSGPDLIITMRHVRAAKMCSRGGRAFAQRHGLDWDRFLRDGIPASELAATGDAMALKLLEVARGQQ